MLKRIFALIVAMILLAHHDSLFGSPWLASPQDTIRIALSVSPQQEKNFNAFIAWLNKHQSLKRNDSLKTAYLAAFQALKNNNSRSYFATVGRLERLFRKLTSQEKADIRSFMLTRVSTKHDSIPEMKNGAAALFQENHRQVQCIFGNCSITCPSGTKPKCFCRDTGMPDCGCEPYEIED